MKKTKLAVLFAALMTMLSFTSCLNSDGGSATGQWYGIVRVNGYAGAYQFRVADGSIINPSNQSALANTNLSSSSYAYLAATYDTSTAGDVSSKALTMEVFGISPIKTFYVEPDTVGMEDYSNIPFASVNNDNYSGYVSFYTRNDMFIPVSYFYKDSNNSSDKTAELNSHRFAIYYDLDESTPTTLKLHLRHAVTDPSINKERLTKGSEFLHFNIASAVEDFKTANGQLPTSIQIEYLMNSNNAELSSGTNSTTLDNPIDYDSIVDEFDKLTPAQ